MRQPKSDLLRTLIRKLQTLMADSPGKEEKTSAQEVPPFSRRKFISQSSKGALAVALASSLPILNSCGNQDDPKNKQDSLAKAQDMTIAIIGGGVAGLNCAYHLQKAGIISTVYEASKRVGGRILTHYNNTMDINIYPEFGGDFIDSNHEDMRALMKEFKLECIDLEKEKKDKNLKGEIFFFDNRNIPEKEIIKEFSKITGKIKDDILALGEDYDTPRAVTLDNTPLDTYIHQLNCAKWFKQLLNASFAAEFGLECAEQSTLNMLDMINPDTSKGFEVFGSSDEKFRVKGGNSKIIEALTQKIGNDSLKKNYQLVSIENAPENKYRLSFENEEIVLADLVVMAIPFTMLRKINMSLKEMTPEKKKCIDELGMGNNTKLALAFDGSPWKEAPNNATGRLCQAEISNGWDGGYNKDDGNPYGVYICYFGGNFSQELCNISFKNEMAPPGHLWRTELPEKTVSKLVRDLDKSFPGSGKKFRKKHVYINWIDYPWTKGSYSCYKTGQWTSISGEEIKPIGNVFFAGEHCSTDFQGFMNGGAETGRMAAEEILKIIKT